MIIECISRRSHNCRYKYYKQIQSSEILSIFSDNREKKTHHCRQVIENVTLRFIGRIYRDQIIDFNLMGSTKMK